MVLIVNVVDSEIEELSKTRSELERKLSIIENLNESNENEVAELVGEYMTGDISQEDLEDELDRILSKLSSLEDIKDTLSRGDKLDNTQRRFLKKEVL